VNIALPAIVFFALALPGFLFRSRLKKVEQTSIDHSPFGRVVIEAVLWSFGLHVIWVLLGSLFFGETVRLATLLELLSSATVQQTEAIRRVQENQAGVARYFISLYLVSYVAPTAIRAAITRWRLDRHDSPLSPVLRFHQAPWYYLLTAADFENKDEVDYIQVTVVINVAGAPIMFTGVLADFFFNADGQLDRLVLENVLRRPFIKDEQVGSAADEGFFPIEGDYFVVKYDEVITLNIQYIQLQEADPA
jgi:hypothetical protein